MVANSLVGIIAQRLMRKICPDCGEGTIPTAEERLIVGEDIKKIMHPKGCPQCNYTGYRGRIAIHEVLMIDRTVRQMIMDGASAEAIQDYAVEKQKMKTLKDAGLSMVREGVTSVEELKKVAYYK